MSTSTQQVALASEKNKQITLQEYSQRLRINFNAYLSVSGGTRVILEIARRLAAKGHIVTINAIGHRSDAEWLGNQQGVRMNFSYPSKARRLIEQKIRKRNFRDVQEELLTEMASNEPFDINVATYCLTASPTIKTKNGSMFYLVQNYEPSFFTQHALISKAEESYKLPMTKLCVSKWLKEKVGGIHIGNGVSTQVFHSKNSFQEKEPNSIMYIYRGISWKGDALAIKTLTRLNNLFPQTKIHVVTRKQNSEQIGLTMPFQLHVDPSDEELAELYSKMRVLLFTSEFEGYGLPPLEAMACETNVVSTDFIGNEYLENGRNCFLASEPNTLAQSSLKLMTCDELAQEQIQNGQKTVRSHDFDIVTRKVLEAFQLYRNKIA